MNKGEKVQPTITVLICTRNEAENLPYVLPNIPDIVDEILIVDADSSDETVKVAKELCPSIRVIFQPGKGKGDALKYGFELAKGDIIIALDADGSMDPR